MNTDFGLNNKQLSIIKNILTKRLSNNTDVWIFGSRATQNNKLYSDIDVLLHNKDNSVIDFKLIAQIQADFIDSDLPYKVDVVDYNSISGIFKQNVDSSKIKFLLN